MPNPQFKGQRREIAVVLNGRKRTLYETAKALGRRSGDIQKVLRQMHAEGILGPEGEDPTRGTEFWLLDNHVEALEDALRSDQPLGAISPDQHLLLLRSATQDALDFIFSRADLIGGVSWAARIGDGEMLIGLAPEASESAMSVLHRALQKVGIKVSRHRTISLMGAEEMRRTAIAAEEAARDLETEPR